MVKMKLNLIVMTGMFFLSGCFSVEQMENEESASTNEEKTSYAPEAHDESTSHPSTTVDSDSTEESSTEEPAVEPETSGLFLTYNQRAQYLTLYTNCINCHNNARGIDFGDVDVAINNVELALSDSNIDASSGEDAVVDAAISSLVDLYRTQGDGGPFNRTGNDAIGTNMSDKSSISHSSQQRTNLDKLEEWIKNEHGL